MLKLNMEISGKLKSKNRHLMLQSLLTCFIHYTLKSVVVKVKLACISTRGRQSPNISQRSSSVGSDTSVSATF